MGKLHLSMRLIALVISASESSTQTASHSSSDSNCKSKINLGVFRVLELKSISRKNSPYCYFQDNLHIWIVGKIWLWGHTPTWGSTPHMALTLWGVHRHLYQQDRHRLLHKFLWTQICFHCPLSHPTRTWRGIRGIQKST